MEEAKLQALHDSLSSKHHGHDGLGLKQAYSWQRKRRNIKDAALRSESNHHSSATESLLQQDRKKEVLYRYFVPEGNYDATKRYYNGDGRVIKRDFSDIANCDDDGGVVVNGKKRKDQKLSDESSETSKRQRKKLKKEAKKASAKAAKLEAKRQAKLQEKKLLRKETKKLKREEALSLPSETSDQSALNELPAAQEDSEGKKSSATLEPPSTVVKKDKKRSIEVHQTGAIEETVTRSKEKQKKRKKDTKKGEKEIPSKQGQSPGESTSPDAPDDIAKTKKKEKSKGQLVK